MSNISPWFRTHSALTGGVMAAALGLLHSVPAAAQSNVVADPPELRARGEAGAGGLEALPSAPSDDVTFDLNIRFKEGTIRNPATGQMDRVMLRAYEGTETNQLFVSPTIRARPGQTVRVSLNNELPAEASCAPGGDHGDVNKPHCFNGTNLHTHGLWVNPAGNGDNVLLSINPGVRFDYEYNIPKEHPAGTFWYHTHRHGSTALQVSSGMAGALIVEGTRLPTLTAKGDLDTLIAGAEAKERVLVLQQIQYACWGKDGKVQTTGNGTYFCDSKDVGEIRNYDVFGPGSWGKSGRYTSINGLILPDFVARQGQVERWRMIHGGVRDTIALQFYKAKASSPPASGPRLAAGAMEKHLADSCSTTPLPYYLIAADGLTMAKAQRKTVAVFQPGYRFDALVVFPEAGSYCVVDTASEASSSVGGLPSGSRLLGMVRVERGTAVPDLDTYVSNRLVAAAERTMPPQVRPAVVADLKQALKLSRFVPHDDIGDAEVTGQQELTFFINVKSSPVRFEVGSQDYEPRPYAPDRVDRQLTLGGVDEWTMRSAFDSHPFHIHVNPFQILEIRDPNGRDVSGGDTADDYGPVGSKKKVDPQYAGLKGVWKDTLWLKSIISSKVKIPEGTDGIYTVKVRTRYQRYIGEFVLHCHILDHEDQGMMQNVAIVLPGGNPASVNAGTGGHGGH